MADVVKVGATFKVKVLTVDAAQRRLALTMKGTGGSARGARDAAAPAAASFDVGEAPVTGDGCSLICLGRERVSQEGCEEKCRAHNYIKSAQEWRARVPSPALMITVCLPMRLVSSGMPCFWVSLAAKCCYCCNGLRSLLS